MVNKTHTFQTYISKPASTANDSVCLSYFAFLVFWFLKGRIFDSHAQTVTEHISCVLMFKFWERIKLYLMPPKHQPDFSFLRHVPLRRVHLFTLVQIICLAVLWILKSTFLAIIFPVMVSVIHIHPSIPLPASFSAFQSAHLIKIVRNVQDLVQEKSLKLN